MKEKKNIDNIFNEGFKNFEATPSPHVWENIQTELKKEKNERKVIPLWVKLGGVAALLALLLTVGNSLYNSSDSVAPTITNENVKQTENQFQENKSEIEKDATDSQVASEEKTNQNTSSQNSDTTEENISNNSGETKLSNRKLNSSKKTTNSVIASSNSENNSSKIKDNTKKGRLETNTSENNIKESIATTKGRDSEKGNIENNVNEANKDFINKDKLFDTKTETGIVNENSENNLVKTEEEIAQESKNKKSIFDAIAEKDEEVISEKNKKERPEHRWNVAPNVAPVYYSSFGNGSSIDPSFADNPQNGDVNMSYGVQVSYAVSKRLSIRTGVNNVDLGYSTSGIEVGTGPVAVALSSVDYGSRQIVVTAADKGSFTSGAPSNGFGNVTPKSTKGDAKLIQNINYYEVPVELKYAVINSRFGINLIGGVSTLLLGNNEISVKADNFNSVLGEANNLSTVSFSTNIGLGLDYKLSKKFTFNIEPMFKYQLNPYTDSSVKFNPYILGVYSGLSFKF
ncbi:MAG: hypothetical protein COA40_04980 [Aequorivita sp.]|nr:MAG: hypothetical protein COA40_04980 [Aequorivita sp.]